MHIKQCMGFFTFILHQKISVSYKDSMQALQFMVLLIYLPQVIVLSLLTSAFFTLYMNRFILNIIALNVKQIFKE